MDDANNTPDCEHGDTINEEPNQNKIELTSVVWHNFERAGRATDEIERAVCQWCK